MDSRIEAVIKNIGSGDFEDWQECGTAFAQELGKVLAQIAQECDAHDEGGPQECCGYPIGAEILRAVDVGK